MRIILRITESCRNWRENYSHDQRTAAETPENQSQGQRLLQQKLRESSIWGLTVAAAETKRNLAMSKKCACKIFPKKSPLRTAPLSSSSSSSSSVGLMIIFDDRSAATRIVISSSTKSQRLCGLVILFLIIVNLRWEGAPRSRSRYQQGHPGAGAPPRGWGGMLGGYQGGRASAWGYVNGWGHQGGCGGMYTNGGHGAQFFDQPGGFHPWPNLYGGGGGGRSGGGGGGGMMFNGNANGAPVDPRIPAAVAATGSASRRKWTSKCRNLASFLLEM